MELQPQVSSQNPQNLFRPPAPGLLQVSLDSVPDHLVVEPPPPAPLREAPAELLVNEIPNLPGVQTRPHLINSHKGLKGIIEKKYFIAKGVCRRSSALKMTPGERLKKAREVLNLTQKDFGEPLGLKWHKIRDLESGKLRLSGELAFEIEKKFCISARWLLTGEGPMFLEEPGPERSLPPDLAEALKNPRIQKIVLMLKQLPEEDLEEIYRDLQKTKRQREERERLLKEIEELKKLLKTA